MLYRKIIAGCSEIHKNILCGQNVEFYTLSPYRAINTLLLGYKNQSVNAV